MQLQDNKTLLASFQAKDAKGFNTALEARAVPAWDVSDAFVLSVVPAADGLSAVVTPVGLGTAKVQMSVPAVGDEPAIQAVSEDISVVAGVAVTAQIGLAAQ